MKKLVLAVLCMVSFSGVSQSPKSVYIKKYKNGKIIEVKQINLPKGETIVVNKTKTIYKTKIKEVPVPKIEYKIVEVAGKPTALDTVAILQSYYPKNTFKEVLALPENQGRVTIIDTVSHNRLVGRKWFADVTPKIVKEVKEVPAPKVRQVFLGPEFTTNFNKIYNWYGANILIKSKSDNIIKIGGGVTMRDNDNNASPFLTTGFYFKIK